MFYVSLYYEQAKFLCELAVFLCAGGLGFIFLICGFWFVDCGFWLAVVTPVVGGIKSRPFKDYGYWLKDTLCITPALRAGYRAVIAKSSH